ncbi:hypothetical protein N7488_012501 [Penicillium malachiteum]|nr:hypothetical protein N7488_012501 [Penicillium malachiteum]
MRKAAFAALKEEFSAALAEVRQGLQALAHRPAAPQPHLETCLQNNHDEIVREIQSLHSPSYTDVVCTPPSSYLSNIRTLLTLNTTPISVTNMLYCIIDTSKMPKSEKGKVSAGLIRAIIETEIRAMDDHTHWRCRAVTVSP